jgi:hypothetical protein
MGTVKPRWFDIADEGWARVAAARPIDRLILEAVQNALDAGAANVSVEVEADRVVVEDDAARGIGDPRLVYTLFLTDKAADPTRRGRMGRGLKELVASGDRAIVESAGSRVEFDDRGRTVGASARDRGTRVEVMRAIDEADRDLADTSLRLVIPPRGVALRVNGKLVRRPRTLIALPSCELETVVIDNGVERAAMRSTTISAHSVRRGEEAHLFEMGIPVATWNVPWHVDVQQRVPLAQGRDLLPERFVLAVKATLLEATMHRQLGPRELRADWVQEVLARWPLRSSILDAYCSKVLPRGSVLGGSVRANDRARQLGAHVVQAQTMSQGTYLALGRVLETADDYVRRRSREFVGDDVEPDETQRAFADAVRWLARRIAGSVVRVRFFARDPSDAGLLEDATTDRDARVISFNVRSTIRFDDVLDPMTSGVVMHELAHLVTLEHDHRFIDRLQFLGGALAKLLAEGGSELAGKLRRGDPDR